MGNKETKPETEPETKPEMSQEEKEKLKQQQERDVERREEEEAERSFKEISLSKIHNNISSAFARVANVNSFELKYISPRNDVQKKLKAPNCTFIDENGTKQEWHEIFSRNGEGYAFRKDVLADLSNNHMLRVIFTGRFSHGCDAYQYSVVVKDSSVFNIIKFTDYATGQSHGNLCYDICDIHLGLNIPWRCYGSRQIFFMANVSKQEAGLFDLRNFGYGDLMNKRNKTNIGVISGLQNRLMDTGNDRHIAKMILSYV